MKKNVAKLLLLLVLGCGVQEKRQVNPEITGALDSLYNNQQYFKFREKLASNKHLLPEKEFLLLSSQLHTVFNRSKASDSIIERLFSSYEEELTREQQLDLLEAKISNSLFLFDYAEALHATEKLLAMDSLSEEKAEEHENQLIIFRELQHTPAQTISLVETELPITKDIAGLSRIPVSLNTVPQQVVFDTGANFSVITDSLALRSGIRIGDKTFKVTATTGGKVDSRIGVADSLRLGATVLHNVVFLVFPEESLSFNEGRYTIDAILGFPVINALENLRLVQGKTFFFSRAAPSAKKENLALDFLTPVVEVIQNDKSLAFTFDTGATTTALYEEYYLLNEEEIQRLGTRDSINLGGAGGSVKIPVYKAPFEGAIGDSWFRLEAASIHLKEQADNRGIYGNLGQDVLKQFDTLSLDFRNMRIELN